MRNETFWAAAAGMLAGALLVNAFVGRDEVNFGPATAQAGHPVSIDEGETFVSTDGGNAYLWRRDGDRLVLVNHCKTVESTQGQTAYVSQPGVERGS